MRQVLMNRKQGQVVAAAVIAFFAVCAPSGVNAQLTADAAPPAEDRSVFAVPPGLGGKVEFWRDMFVKYGKNQRVFHHREFPEIVYSVLDFTEYQATLSGRDLQKTKEQAVERETRRIQSALRSLSVSGKAANPFERRIKHMFAGIGRDSPGHYERAASDEFIRYQAGLKERFREGLVRSGRYLYAIEEIFRAEGLPPELGRLPHVESSFDYEAYSSAGAAGIWQFVRSTGSRYLRINASIDERRDPILATRAAAKYLKNAYAHVRSWPIAVTSYNHGLAGMIRAIEEVGTTDIAKIIDRYTGRTFGFASKNFYAEFLAALEVDRNAARYFPGLQRETPLRFDEIKLGRSMTFRDLMQITGESREKLSWLNRSFRDPVLTSRVPIPSGFMVKVPSGKGQRLLAAAANSRQVGLSSAEAMDGSIKKRKPRSSLPVYVVQKGDTVGGIAKRFRVPEQDLAAANSLGSGRTIRVGQGIVIPEGSEVLAEAQRPAKTKALSANRERTYTVRPGDTLSGIAKKHKTTVAKLKKVNPNLGALLKPGQKIALP